MDNGNYYYDPQQGSYGPPPRKQRHGGGGVFAAIIIIVVLVLLAALIIGLFAPNLMERESSWAPTPTATPTPTPQVTPEPTDRPEATATPVIDQEDRTMPEFDGLLPNFPNIADNPIPDIFDAVAPGVVGVINYQSQMIGGRERIEVYGSGSGFIVFTSGYILTNAHVIDGASIVAIRFEDGEEVEAKIIGADKETDVAVLKIEKSGLSPLALGDSDAVRVGEYALAIGNPLDADELANTITFGIISAKAREITIDSYTNTYLQTDAAINFGNSGGPLLNMKGEVIGMNSAKTVTAGYDAFGNAISAEGIGFALPINKVCEIMEILVNYGIVVRPGIGITVSTVSETRAELEGLPLGAYVENVVRGGPADQGGLKAGDVIVEANGKETLTQSELIAIVGTLKIGDKLTLRVFRGGEYIECVLTVANKSRMDFNDTSGD